MPAYTRKKNRRKAKNRKGGTLREWMFPSYDDEDLYLENFYRCHKAKVYSYRCKFIKRYGNNGYLIVGKENQRLFQGLMFETMIKFLREMSEKSYINQLHDTNTVHAKAVLKLFKLIANNIYVITEKNEDGKTYHQTIQLRSDYNKNTVWYKRYWNKVVKSGYNYLTNEDKFFYLSNLLEILQTTYNAPINGRTDIVNIIQDIYPNIAPPIVPDLLDPIMPLTLNPHEETSIPPIVQNATEKIRPVPFENRDLQYQIDKYLNGNVDKYVDISLWDISNITNLSRVFSNLIDTPEKNDLIAGISLWKVGHITMFVEMFDGCTAFNQPLNDWDVSNSVYMRAMFRGCSSFNQPLDKWTKFKCTDLSSMFEGCTAFNQPLNGWDVSNVRNMDNMFNGCTAFNQDLTEWKVDPKIEGEYGLYPNKTSINHMFDGCDSLTIFPYWYMGALETIYPKRKPDFPIIPQRTNASTIVVGDSLSNGIPTYLPDKVSPFDPTTKNLDYLLPQERISNEFIKTLNNYERALLKQYTHTECYLEEVDCYVGNRLTTYLLTKHPEIIRAYPQYENPLNLEEFSESAPVSFENRYTSEEKLLAILQGVRDLNALLKKFPPLDDSVYPNGCYLYRGKSYEGEIEKLIKGTEIVLSKLTSTSMDVRISAEAFGSGITTKYYDGFNLVKKLLGFIWRIKLPQGLPCPYIGNIREKEVVLPLGTRLRYLGAYVQRVGRNSIYERHTTLNSNTGERGTMEGALICEFEVVSMKDGPLLSVLADAVKQDFRKGERGRAIYAKDFTLPSNDWNKYLRKKNQVGEAFGKKRKTHKKKPRRTSRMRFTHTPKRNRPRATRKK